MKKKWIAFSSLILALCLLASSLPAYAATTTSSAYNKLVATYSKKSRHATLLNEGDTLYNVYVYATAKETRAKTKPAACPAQGKNLFMNQYRIAYFKKGGSTAEIMNPGSFPLTGKYTFVYTLVGSPNLLVFATCETAPLSSYHIYAMVNGTLKQINGLSYGVSNAIRATGSGLYQNVEYTPTKKQWSFVNYKLDKTKLKFVATKTYTMNEEEGKAAYAYWNGSKTAVINDAYIKQHQVGQE
ncbi:hypothetical protein FHS18_002690 [Paenibacillus phyllosphaerae]|uniref:Uncharacterized protein n=1 Tax=Paenibacillus phyllosphaerae TaxID=274593 RepID=A0A7W5FMY5_9BACL|nr:hypothetical protein [Paenibacillus phyllosphaerae]MBB3110623.1 hypothetical protein [Paenibacillus phyllosphaerae]